MLTSKACVEGRAHIGVFLYSSFYFLRQSFRGLEVQCLASAGCPQSPQAPPGCLSALGLSVHATMLDFYMDSGSPNSDSLKNFTHQGIFPVPETPPSPKQNRTNA